MVLHAGRVLERRTLEEVDLEVFRTGSNTERTSLFNVARIDGLAVTGDFSDGGTRVPEESVTESEKINQS